MWRIEMVEIVEDFEVDDCLDSDNELSIELTNEDEAQYVISKFLDRKSAVKLAKHLSRIFKITLEELAE